MTTRTDPVVVTLICEASARTETETIDRAEWEAMTPTQRAQRVQEMAADNMNASGGYGWHIDDEADYAMVGDTPRPVNPDEVMRLATEYGAECAAHGPLTVKAIALIEQIRAAVTR